MGSLEPDHSNGGSASAAAAVGRGRGKGSRAVADRQPGGSMMEQLVPEITTHALSYLDYPSLCRLSMTNSAMRRAANDDNAWKALYHKDFTVEQDNITPPNGWKSYYAVTKAVIKANSAFYNSIKDRSLSAMGHVWFNADYVKCIHVSGDLYTGYTAVMESWAMAFDWFHHAQGGVFEIRDVMPRVSGSIAWVTMRAFVEMSRMPFYITNIYEFHDGRWHLVHHHSSLILLDGEVEQLNFLE